MIEPPINVLQSPARVQERGNKFLNVLVCGLRKEGVVVRHWPAVRLGGQNVFHVHWPEFIFLYRRRYPRIVGFILEWYFWFTIWLVKSSGGVVTWTAHNLVPHDIAQMPVDEWNRFFGRFVSSIDGFAVMTSASQKLLEERYETLAHLPCRVIPHPHYGGHMPLPSPAVEEWKRRWSRHRTTFGCIGALTSGKGVVQLAERFSREGRPGQALVLAGATSAEIRGDLRRIVDRNPDNIFLIDRALSDQELVDLHQSIDIIVFYSRTHLNSGTIVQALSQGRKVLAFFSTPVKELFDTVGYHAKFIDEWENLGDAVEDCARSDWQPTTLDRLSSSSVARQHVEMWRALLKQANLY